MSKAKTIVRICISIFIILQYNIIMYLFTFLCHQQLSSFSGGAQLQLSQQYILPRQNNNSPPIHAF